jgi:hypothetical protein
MLALDAQRCHCPPRAPSSFELASLPFAPKFSLPPPEFAPECFESDYLAPRQPRHSACSVAQKKTCSELPCLARRAGSRASRCTAATSAPPFRACASRLKAPAARLGVSGCAPGSSAQQRSGSVWGPRCKRRRRVGRRQDQLLGVSPIRYMKKDHRSRFCSGLPVGLLRYANEDRMLAYVL